MRTKHPSFIEGICAFVGCCLVPRAALAHGESVLVFLFWEVAVVPWALIVFLAARRRVFEQIRQNRLGPLTVVTTLVAIFGGWWGIAAVAEVTQDPTPLSPLLLAISGAPPVWYLWRQGEHRLAVTLLLIPIVLAGSCSAWTWSYP